MSGLVLLLLAQAAAVAGQTLSIESRVEQARTWESRIQWEEEGRLRLAALAVYDGGSPERRAAGIETPWMVAGPLAPQGLVRLVESPLESGPAGSVHAEATGFSLDSSFDGGARSGVVAWPLPGSLGLGAFARDGRLTAVALAAGSPLPALRWEALGARSAPAADPPGEAWFAEEPPWPGGPLAHAALRATLEAGGIQAAAAAGMSAAARARPGGWGLLRLQGRRGGGSGTLLLGAAGGDARDTAGAPLRPLRRAALRAEARAAGWRAWAEGSACSGPGALAGSWGAGTRRLRLAAAARARRGEPAAWEASARLEGRRFDAEVRRAGSGRLSAEARWESGPLRLRAEGCWQEGRLEELQAGLRARKPGLEADLTLGWSAAGRGPWVSLGWRAIRRLRPGAGPGRRPTPSRPR